MRERKRNPSTLFSPPADDSLTLYLDNTGHAFIGVKCKACADGKPANFKAGFYPKVKPPKCKDEINKIENDYILDNIIDALRKLLVPFLKYYNLVSIYNYPIPASVAVAFFSAVYSDQEYSVLNDGAMDGKTKCNATEGGINFIKNGGYLKEELASFYHITYDLNPDGLNPENARKVYDRVKFLAENQVVEYPYRLLGGRNCVDFTKDIYDITSLEKKSLTRLYKFNPLISITGLNGMAGLYMVVRDTSNIVRSDPISAVVAGYAIYGLYKWVANKLSRSIGTHFDPKSITKTQRKDHKNSIKKAREAIKDAIDLLTEPLINARDAVNNCYGVASRKDEYKKLDTYYRHIKYFIQSCEKKLDEINQLNKDYDSLSKAYCSTRYANNIILSIGQLSGTRYHLNSLVDQFTIAQQGSELTAEIGLATRRLSK